MTESTELRGSRQATPRVGVRSKWHPMRMATRTAAPPRTSRTAGRGLACALVCGATIGCTASGVDIEPKRDQLAFPTGLKVSPDGMTLFVVNANSELRYDSGSLDVFSVNRIDQVITKWLGYLAPPPQGTVRTDCATFTNTTLPSPVAQ